MRAYRSYTKRTLKTLKLIISSDWGLITNNGYIDTYIIVVYI